MSGLNASLGYFLAIVGVSVVGRVLFARWTLLTEFIAAFALAACRLEVDTIAEVGQWAGALGPDVAVTMLFISLAVHGVVMQGVSGNPSVTLMELLQKDVGAVSVVLSVAAQLFGAYAAVNSAVELLSLDTALIRSHKSTLFACALKPCRLNVSFTCCSDVNVDVKYFNILTNVSVTPGNNYTSGYVNPSLAYAMTFTCPGHTFLAYSLVYWLGPLIGESIRHVSGFPKGKPLKTRAAKET
uniref:Aquaporin-12-like n=1 Tax=Sinocyclocheilus anshuiensis TaxID=1608454 RepID=A0A671N0E4_9TELE